MGTLVNDWFVGVTKDNLSRYYILTLILLITRFLPLTIIKLMVPTNEAVNEVQNGFLQDHLDLRETYNGPPRNL